MSSLSKLTISLLVCLLAGLALAGQFFHVRQEAITLPSYTANAGELIHTVLIGQTFVAESNNLSAIALQFATYSNRDNDKPVEFHLRESVSAGQDIRSSTISAKHLRDNQFYRFEFEPIANSAGKTFFFFVTSPQSTPANAVTVDINTQDPYFKGSAYIVRGGSSDPATLATGGKPTIDLSFSTYHTVLLREAVVRTGVDAVRTVIGTWPEKKGTYTLYGQAFAQAIAILIVLFILFGYVLKQDKASSNGKNKTAILLGLLFFVAMGIRFRYATSLPITNDEGNYLYDASTLLDGRLAGGDGYVKTPLVILWISVWQLLFGHTVIAGRLASIVISAVTMFPLYALAKDIWGRKVGIVAAALWALAGTAVVSGVYVHTQALSLFFATWGLATLLSALRGNTPPMTFITRKQTPSAGAWFFFAGVLFGLGVASRKSILALGLVPLFLIAVEGKDTKKRLQHLLYVGAGFVLVIMLFLGTAYLVYGPVGVVEAIGINSAEDGIATPNPDEIEQVRAYSLRGMTPFFRESLPLIFGVLLGLGIAAERLLAYLVKKIPAPANPKQQFFLLRILPKLGWIIAWILFLWAWNFFSEYEGQIFIDMWGTYWLWYAFLFVGVLTCVSWRPVLPVLSLDSSQETVVAKSLQPDAALEIQAKAVALQKQKETQLKKLLTSCFMILVWVGGLAFFYMNWIKFHANYISEFIPPLTLLAAYGFSAVWKRLIVGPFFAQDHPVLELGRRVMIGGIAVVICWGLFVSNYITYVFEHTGTFDQQAVKRAAAWAKDHIPSEDPIFTGAAVVPYVAGRHISLDIAHPRWYAYEFTRTNPERVNTFLPSAQNMVASFREASWVLVDDQTVFSFFNEYGEIEQGVKRDFVPVQVIENGSNELTFYQRVR